MNGRGWSAGALGVVGKLVDLWHRRRVVGQLASLDDHLLADLGLSRADVLSALSEPLFADPSAFLAARALDGRRTRRTAQQVAQLPGEGAAPTVPRRAA